MDDTARILDKLDEIHRDLGKLDGILSAHTRSDEQALASIEGRLQAATTAQAVAEATAKKEGGARGRTWGAIVAGGVAVAAEVAKAVFR